MVITAMVMLACSDLGVGVVGRTGWDGGPGQPAQEGPEVRWLP